MSILTLEQMVEGSRRKFFEALAEAAEEYVDAVGSHPDYESGCCGDMECCPPEWPEPPITLEEFDRRGERINWLTVQLERAQTRASEAERNLESHKQWVATVNEENRYLRSQLDRRKATNQ